MSKKRVRPDSREVTVRVAVVMGEAPRVVRLTPVALLVPQRMTRAVVVALKVRGSRRAVPRPKPKPRIDALTALRQSRCRVMKTVIVMVIESMQTTIAGIAPPLMQRIRALQAVEVPMARQLLVRGVKAQADSERRQRNPRAAALCGRLFERRFVLLASD